MPSVRGADSRLEADGIAHFADHDDVWILSKHMFEGVLEGLSIQTDFPLFEHRLIVLKHIFNGVLESDDMFFVMGVDVLDHRRERGRFSGAGGAGEEHDATGGFGDFSKDREQPQFFKGWHLRFHITHCETILSALLEKISPEASGAGEKIGEIHFAIRFKLGASVLGEDALNNLLHPFCGRNRCFDGDELTVNSEENRPANLDMQIGSVAVHRRLQYLLKQFHAAQASKPHRRPLGRKRHGIQLRLVLPR